MNISTFNTFAWFGLKTILFREKKPILGTVILTDRCNLKCRHCAVNNITSAIHPHVQIQEEMRRLYGMGVRILFFCGGETFLWEEGGCTLRDLVREARKMGFLIVNVVTNGTFPIDIPEADLILLSLDGNREKHNLIRSDTYDRILYNIHNATARNIVLYMAINQLNKGCISDVVQTAEKESNIKAVSFNFHTPYPGTEGLSLSQEEKKECCSQIARLKKNGAPIFNLTSAFPYLIDNSFPTPCHQCLVIENGKLSICGRCIDIPGLCQKCGYFFVAEYTLLFRGKLPVLWEMLRTYLKYI